MISCLYSSELRNFNTMARNGASHFCSLDLDGIENEVTIRELESLFKKTMGEDAILLHYRISAKHHNDDRMLKTAACVKTTGCTIWKLSLMTKLKSALQYPHLINTAQFNNNTVAAFSKEIFFYETLIPAYERLYNDGKFKISPKYYGGRCCMEEEDPEEILYDDAVLLIENMETRGYYTTQKYYGLDLEHAKMAITALARFHALGMGVKEKMPRIFDDAKNVCDVPYDFRQTDTRRIIKIFVDIVGRPGLPNQLDEDIIERIKTNMEENNWNAWFPPSKLFEPWVTILHGEFSIDSLLFHNTLEGAVDDVKIIDFHQAKVGSPQADLIFFLGVNLDLETQENHIDELIDLYYDKLIENLCAIDVNITELSRESFDQHLETIARTELFHCLMGLKWATFTDEYTVQEIVYMTSLFSNELFKHRSRMAAVTFAEKDWL